MKNYNTIFKQILNMIPRRQFDYEASKGGYNKYTKHFTVWNQFLVNLYAQVSGKKSLRDVESGLQVQYKDWYHLGLKNISRSQLAYSNKKRDYKIFKNLYYRLFSKCSGFTPKHKFKFKNPLHALDSTTISLCLSVFPWAKFRKKKGALKLHTLLDLKGSIPSFITVTDGKQHDVKIAKESALPLLQDSIIVCDKAYIDFEWFYKLNNQGIFFVTRMKDNMDYDVLGQHKKIKHKKIYDDFFITLSGKKSYEKYPDKLRIIDFYDEETGQDLNFMTNNFHLAASTIANIYKCRWQIELFFKWIKQNLKIKTFLGTSENAVMTQIWIAMIYYLLLTYIRFQTKLSYSLLHFTRVIREALFKKMDIIDILNINPNKIKQAREPCKQRTLFHYRDFL